MGSYGIGVSRLVGALIEANYDNINEIMKWPLSVAPYECAIIPMLKKNNTININLIKSNQAYKYLISKNIDTIIDDSDENISSKIKKFNLIGAPFQIIIGNNSEGELFEFKEIGKDSQKLKIEEIANKIQTIKLN